MGKNLKLKSARVALGMSQQGVANSLGVTRQTISAVLYRDPESSKQIYQLMLERKQGT